MSQAASSASYAVGEIVEVQLVRMQNTYNPVTGRKYMGIPIWKKARFLRQIGDKITVEVETPIGVERRVYPSDKVRRPLAST